MCLLLFLVNPKPCSAEKGNKDFTNDIKSDFSLDDLNFDPAAIIGEGSGDWSVSFFKIILWTNLFLSQIFEVEFLVMNVLLSILSNLLTRPFQLNNMDPGDLLSFLDGPGDLATPPSSGGQDSRGLPGIDNHLS